jgi:hypothetical protein
MCFVLLAVSIRDVLLVGNTADLDVYRETLLVRSGVVGGIPCARQQGSVVASGVAPETAAIGTR